MLNRIIFSVYQSDKTKEVNHENHSKVKKDLNNQGIPYDIVVANYKGVKELCFVLSHENYMEHDYNMILAEQYVTEFKRSYMVEVSGNESSCWLLNSHTNRDKFLGNYVLASKEFAEKSEFYVYNPIDKSYYRSVDYI